MSNNTQSKLTQRQALNLFDALKSAGIITGDEFDSDNLRRDLSGKLPHWIAMFNIIREHKAAYINALPAEFFEHSKKYKDFAELAKNIYEVSLKNGGSTTYINTGIPVVSGNIAAELSAPVLKVKTLTPAVIENYIRTVYDTWFKGLNAKRYFLGLWYYKEEREWHINISKDIGSEDEALEYCWRNGLRAFYSLSYCGWNYYGKTVYVDDL